MELARSIPGEIEPWPPATGGHAAGEHTSGGDTAGEPGRLPPVPGDRTADPRAERAIMSVAEG